MTRFSQLQLTDYCKLGLLACLILHTPFLTAVASDPPLRKQASWDWPSAARYQDLLASYLEQVGADVEVQRQVQAQILEPAGLRGPELVDQLLVAAGIIDPRIAELNAALKSPTANLVALKELSWIASDTPGWLQDTIRLAFGRAYAQRKLYDEALEVLHGLELAQVSDPSSLLFYRAAAEHHLLKKSECLDNLKLLLQREEELPLRFRQIALLMQADISPMKEDSLDEISRMMGGVQRRLELGRAGQRVRDEEEQIIAKLDKMIDQIEQQAQQMMQQQSASQDQQNSGQQAQQQPMEESQIAGGSGPGDVDPKSLKDRSAWGNLPPAQRQESLQRLTEELPSHYREVIEGYFRQLAKDRSSTTLRE
jgi:hypothetical protein